MVITKTSMHVGSFLVYLCASCLLLVGLLRLADRRKYYFHFVPFVVGYAVLAALLLCYLGFQDFFWWYLVLSSAFFFANLRRHLGSKDALDAFAQLQASVAQSIPEGEIRHQVTKELSPTRQIGQNVAVSVVIFIVSFVLTFYLVNGRF
jgi:hypothetical protein